MTVEVCCYVAMASRHALFFFLQVFYEDLQGSYLEPSSWPMSLWYLLQLGSKSYSYGWHWNLRTL